jgi:hypothetical protein
MKSVPVSSAFFAAITTLLGQGALVDFAEGRLDNGRVTSANDPP